MIERARKPVADADRPPAPTSSSLTRRTFLERAGLGSIVLVGGLPAIIAACGSSPSASAGATPTASAAASSGASPTPASISGQQGVLWGLQFDPHIATQTKIVEAFEAKTGAKIELQPQAGEGAVDGGKILAALAGGTAPDVACQLGLTLVPLYVRGALVDVTDVFADAGIDPKTAFLGDSALAFTWQERLWGVPLEVNSTSGVNVPIGDARSKGLNPPPLDGEDQFESFEAMWELAEAVQVKDSAGNVTKWGLSGNSWEYGPILSVIRTLGTDWWDSEQLKFNLDSEAGVRAFQLVVEEPVKRGIEGEINVNQVDGVLQGTVAMGYGQIGTALNAPRQDPPIEIELVMSPKVDGNEQLYHGEGGWGFVGLAGSEKPELVSEFLRFMASRDGQWEWSQLYGGILSAYREVNEDPNHWMKKDPDNIVARSMTRYLKYIDRHVSLGDGYGYANPIRDGARELSSEIRQGRMTAAEAAKEYQARAEAQYQDYLADLDAL